MYRGQGREHLDELYIRIIHDDNDDNFPNSCANVNRRKD